MNGLIEHILENDPEFTTLTLTMECENDEELIELIDALESNTTLSQVAFRESFFPLRNIRRHLSWPSFLRMLEAVGSKAIKYLFLPPSMMGMVRGVTASHILYSNNACLQELRANESLTFATTQDVEELADCLSECQQLRVVELGDSFFNRSSSRSISSEHMMDPLLLVLADLPNLKQLELSSHYEQHFSNRKPPLISSQALQYFFQQQISTSSSSPPSRTTKFQLLNLSRLGLDDDHFNSIATHFANLAAVAVANDDDEEEEENDVVVPTLTVAAEAATTTINDGGDGDGSQNRENDDDYDDDDESSVQQQEQQQLTLLRLCLDGNRPTTTGIVNLFRSLKYNPPIQSLSLRGITSATTQQNNTSSTIISNQEWSERIFSTNYNLTELEIDEHDNTMLLGGTTNNSNNNNNNNTSSSSNVIEFWTHLNSLNRRRYWQEDSFHLRLELWPLVLEEVTLLCNTGDPSSSTWHVIRNFSQYIIRQQQQTSSSSSS